MTRSDATPTPLPTLIIEPTSGWRALRLGELWQNRELLYYFVWRDLKVRYKQTAFGAAWAVLQPLLLMAAFSLTLGRVPGVGPREIPYPLFIYVGLVPWTLFAQSLIGASQSVVNAEGIITKVYFPRLLLPISAAGSFLVDFLISLGVLGLLMLYFGVAPTATLVWLPLFALIAVVAALGVGIFLSAVNVRYRDVRYAVPFLVQVWLLASPVIYTSNLIPTQWRNIYALNPMTGVVDGFRWAVLGGPRPDAAIALSAFTAVAMFLGAIFYFRRVERTFADVI